MTKHFDEPSSSEETREPESLHEVDAINEPIVFEARINRIVVQPQTLRRLWEWCLFSNVELSAFGEASVRGNTLIVSDRVHLLKQEGSAGSTHLDMKSLAELLDQMAREGKDLSTILFWWHTHPGMSAFFSSIDESTIIKLSKLNPVILAAVFNSRGETSWELSVRGSIGMVWEYNLPRPIPTHQEQQQWKSLIDWKVTQTQPFWKSWRPRNKPTKTNDPDQCRWKSQNHAGCELAGHELVEDRKWKAEEFEDKSDKDTDRGWYV